MPSQQGKIKYDSTLVHCAYNNDWSDSPRADGGYITLEVQVNYPADITRPSSEGWVTVWHVATTIPHPPARSPPLPESPKQPVFVGEASFCYENDPFMVNLPTAGQKPPTKQAFPFAAIGVPYIGLEKQFQGAGISPVLWSVISEISQANTVTQCDKWKKAKAEWDAIPNKKELIATHQGSSNPLKTVTSEPPLGIVAVKFPDANLKEYWQKVGFNFLAAQYKELDVWSIADETAEKIIQRIKSPGAIKDGTKDIDIDPHVLNVKLAELQAPVDYIATLAQDGLKRYHWTRVTKHSH